MKTDKHSQITSYLTKIVKDFKQFNNYTVKSTNEFKTKINTSNYLHIKN